ncbi:MAG: hypothetical protein K5855_04950, partial [Oscillospiraceae bacterium]|nr:hypothetical protein [Oscillospiraceae bacterium]
MLVFKRTVSLFLCLLLCAAFLPFGAAAAGAPLVSLSDETAAPGEEVTVTVDLAENPGLMVMAFHISYDHSVLELIGAAGVGLSGWDASGDNILWLGNRDSDFNGTILRLVFRVQESAPAGETPVTLVCGAGDMGNYNEETFVPAITAGSVTVTGTTAPADGSTTAPADGGATAPADGGTTAPADGGTTAPADGGTT